MARAAAHSVRAGPHWNGTIDINHDINCDGPGADDPGPPYYVRRYDPTDPTREGNYYVQVTVEADTTCGTCKQPLPAGTACTAVYLARDRKGTLLGHRCLGECTEGRRINELPPGAVPRQAPPAE